MKILAKLGRAALALALAASTALASLTVTASAADETIKLPENEAIVFADNLGAGWNLGNAFDASNCDSWISNELDYESAWCGAKTTKALITEIKKIGFTTIRIPVSWHNHVDESFKISEQWADRVQEVVDWSLDAGLKVILNVHHDVEKGYYFPTDGEYKNAEKYITTVWRQIAERYKDYDDRLVFEIINEPRETGTNHEWWFNVSSPSAEVKKCIENVNRLNQAALDTIRGAGGKNADRFVIVCGYDTSTDGLTVDGFTLPKDSAKDRLILAFHVYTMKVGEYTGYYKRLYEKYISKGIPAIMDEYNFDANNNKYHAKSAEALGEMVRAAREYGISTVIWDNNDGAYKLIDRATAKWDHKDIAESIVKNGAPKLKETASSTKTEEEDPSQNKSEKPVLTAKASGTKAVLTWTAVEGATKYRVYRYRNGKLVKVKDTTKLKLTISGLTSGKTYQYAVRAYVDGKWTTVKKSEIKSVKIK
ncbi:MAG: cellulase family glycosylhydrolase [Bacteroides sp.]|nr:cellulase family glycosylhydrolase [Eubacterium sp.]MCM1418098.1 cellulase family glycosylhydrolase [Roseburia sp.]MCM1462278.1 cellulase family glycosylhydrolase [Bacteroides sp.]